MIALMYRYMRVYALSCMYLHPLERAVLLRCKKCARHYIRLK